MRSLKVRRSLGTSSAFVYMGFVGCGETSPMTGDAGIRNTRVPLAPEPRTFCLPSCLPEPEAWSAKPWVLVRLPQVYYAVAGIASRARLAKIIISKVNS